MTDQTFPLPDVGEGLTEAEIVAWHVHVGDEVALNDVLVEIETAKSLVELPSPFSGTVSELLVEEGATVDVGTPIIRIISDDDSGAPSPAAPTTEVAPVQAGGRRDEVAVSHGILAEEANGPAEPKTAVLVGYGSTGQPATRRRRTSAPTPAATRASASVVRAAAPSTPELSTPEPSAPTSPPRVGPVLAKPPVRKLAKDLGVDLASLTPTGPIGDVTRDDVIRQAAQPGVFRNLQTPPPADEREHRIPVKGVRKATASAMSQSAFTAPHVSLFVDVDATRTMEFTKRLKASPDFAGVKVSPLLIVAKAVIWAVRRNPMTNSTWTDAEIIVHHFVNLGIAAATPRGLIVPNVKEAQSMSLRELAEALERLTVTARDGKTTPADMSNGTITITNIGVFGMDTGTPILNPGEVSIVAMGAVRAKPWVVDGDIRVRQVTTLGASFDHRVVDGDVASRFLADVAAVVEEPALLLD